MCNSLQQKQSRTELKIKLSTALAAALLSVGLFLPYTNASAEAPNTAAATVQSAPGKSAEEIEQMALRVIRGDFGNGAERVQKLTEINFDAQTVQNRVNEIYAQNDWDGVTAAAVEPAQPAASPAPEASPAPTEAAAPAEVVETPASVPAPVAENVAGDDIVAYAANKMAANTGVSAAEWTNIILAESGGNPNAVNSSSGAYGLFQLLGHGEYPGMSVDDQIAMATQVYHSQGLHAWVVTW